MKEFSVTLLSNNSTQIYPENDFASFTNKLYRPIELDGKEWSVAVTELNINYTENFMNSYRNQVFGPSSNELCFINTEIIMPRHVGDQYTRCLRVFSIQTRATGSESIRMEPQTLYKFQPEFFPIENNFIDEISILLTDEDGEKINFYTKGGLPLRPTFVTLKFRQQ